MKSKNCQVMRRKELFNYVYIRFKHRACCVLMHVEKGSHVQSRVQLFSISREKTVI